MDVYMIKTSILGSAAWRSKVIHCCGIEASHLDVLSEK